MLQSQEQNSHVQRAWYANAEFWDERMAEGNDFFNVLVCGRPSLDLYGDYQSTRKPGRWQ